MRACVTFESDEFRQCCLSDGVGRGGIRINLAGCSQELVKREKSTTDGRSIRIALTSKGDELALRIVPVAKQHESVILSGFTANDVQVLRTMLLKVYENAGALDDLV